MGLTQDDVKRVVWTFVQALIASFIATASGWSALPSMDTAKAAGVSALVAAGAAAIAFVKNLVLKDGATLK